MRILLTSMLFLVVFAGIIFTNIVPFRDIGDVPTGTGGDAAANTSTITLLTGYPITQPGEIDFAGPLVTDIDSDKDLEVLVADDGGCVWAYDSNGDLLPGFPLRPFDSCDPANRINSLAVGDIDGDGQPEIVAGADGYGETPGVRGKIFVWQADGTPAEGWPQEMEWNRRYGTGQAEVYSVALANLVGGPALEVIAGTSNNSSSGGAPEEPTPNLYAYTGDGKLLDGFPTWYRRAGIYGMVAAGDINNDGCMEIIAPRDHRWMHVYDNTGRYLPGWPVETYIDPREQQGHPYMEFTRNAPALADLDGDGVVDLVAAGRVKESESVTGGEIVIINSGVMVFNPDGQLKKGWEVAKIGDGPPLADAFGPSQAPALADLTGDGMMEIVVTLMDGTARAYSAAGDQLWKYDFAKSAKLFASEPVIGDINDDRRVDILFGTYSPDGSANYKTGLIALDGKGKLLAGFPLKLPEDSDETLQGIRSAPALTDFDGDGHVEILVASWPGTLYVWKLPGEYRSWMMPWPTARQNNQRNAFRPPAGAPRTCR